MYPLVRKLLFGLNAETAHELTLNALRRMPGAARLLSGPPHPPVNLRQTVCGRTFVHPIGLAAGLDKNAIALPAWFAVGFAFAEVGTVTPLAQPGNPRPRLFRLRDDEALINRMGFNNEGAAAMRRQLESWQRRRHAGVVGVNLGKNKATPNDEAVSDYLKLTEELGHFADYLVVNVSSPNTPGLRDLQTENSLVPLVRAVLTARDKLQNHPPVFVKLAPDLADDALTELAQQLADVGVDGLIGTNTTIRRDSLTSMHSDETGGLSGRPLEQRSTTVIKLLYQATDGKLPIIGSGGVFSAADAYRKIRAGATLVQVYTGFIYKGPAIVREIVEGLPSLLERDGFSHVSEAVGVDA
ncbi:quinone-dependent dihydroorotate dehydrogenase [Alicyclobacillus sp. ALC3]|nr:quinone-dependent dihydroorotate dehydrogenase [Alicyclobacillus sp. ALC3]